MDINKKHLTLLTVIAALTLVILVSCAWPGSSSQRDVTHPIVSEPPKVAPQGPAPQTQPTANRFTPFPPGAEIIGAASFGDSKRSDGNAPRELFVLDSNGEHITQVTHAGDMYNHFAVSPDRKMIAGVRLAGDTNGNGSVDFADKKTLWILELATGKEWALVPDWDAGWGGVDWSPDSRFVYFSVLRNGVSDIYRISYDGQDLKNITSGINLELPFAAEKKGIRWVSDTGVSPDGEWICFHYTWSGVNKGVIGICRTDGTQARIVTDGGPMKPGKVGPWGAGDFDPEFSPDGTHIVFERTTDTATNFLGMASGDVMTVNVDGTDLKNLSPAGNTSTLGIPDWSQDNRILFSDWSKRDMWQGPGIVNADGSGFHRLEKARNIAWVRWIPQPSK
jgi:Tol biopolymer transport system component